MLIPLLAQLEQVVVVTPPAPTGTGSGGWVTSHRITQRAQWRSIEERLGELLRDPEQPTPKRAPQRRRPRKVAEPVVLHAARALAFVDGSVGVALAEATGGAVASSLTFGAFGVAHATAVVGALASAAMRAPATHLHASATNYGALLVGPRREIAELQDEVEALTLVIARLRLDDAA